MDTHIRRFVEVLNRQKGTVQTVLEGMNSDVRENFLADLAKEHELLEQQKSDHSIDPDSAFKQIEGIFVKYGIVTQSELESELDKPKTFQSRSIGSSPLKAEGTSIGTDPIGDPQLLYLFDQMEKNSFSYLTVGRKIREASKK